MISFALTEMKRWKVGEWDEFDWMRKKMTIVDGCGIVADIVWQRQTTNGYETVRIFGERKIEGGELVLIKYDCVTRQEVEEMYDNLIVWIRPCGRFYDDWEREKEVVDEFRTVGERDEKGGIER